MLNQFLVFLKKTPQNCHFDNFSNSEFEILGIFDIFKGWIFQKSKFKAFKAKIDFV